MAPKVNQKATEAAREGAGQVIQKTSPAALARPEFVPAGKAGTEHIKKDDMQIPRLAIAQALSPQLDETHQLYIEGLKQGDLFNTLSGDIYGRGPMEFYILRADPPRYIEFFPREEGGGVKDFDVPAGDPRTKFSSDGQGNRIKPAATMFYDFFIVFADAVDAVVEARGTLGLDSVIALSMKSSQLKRARDLNTLIKGRQADIYAGKYSLRVVPEQNTKGKYFNFKIDNAGWAPSKEIFDGLAAMSNGLRDEKLTVDRTGDREEDDSFDPNETEV